MSRLFTLIVAATAFAVPASAVPLVPTSQQSRTTASASIPGVTADGQTDLEDAQAVVNAQGVHVQAAGRSQPGLPPVIAANGSFASAAFAELDVRALGTARHEVRMQAPVGRLTLRLELPALLLEFTDNPERLGADGRPHGGDMETRLTVSVCVQASGVPGATCPLSLAASLVGHYGDERLAVLAESSDAAVDLGALENQALTIVDDGFLRTATWSIAGFAADVDISALSGHMLTLVYEVVAVANGFAFGTGAAAGFNDPFLFDTDPAAATPFSVDFQALDIIAVPSPGGLGVLACALCGLAGRRRRQ